MEENLNTLTEGNGFSSVLEGIMSNPEMLSSIKAIAEKLKQNDSQTPKSEQILQEDSKETPVSSAKIQDTISAFAPLLSGDLSKLSRSDDKRACLLRALKPYLSEGRCEAIEYIIKISAMSEIIKNFS